MNRRKWSAEEKARIVLEGLTTHIPMSELCRKHGVNHAAYYKWRDQFLEGGKSALAKGSPGIDNALQAEIRELKQLVGELTIANNSLKKTFL